MESSKIYDDIATRTGGDIYVGVVGPVRTGKSTFIARFMESTVLPRIENDYLRERARDELPQSGSGRTIMTAEPKFIPEEAVEVKMQDGASFHVRLVDCVGYMVNAAIGQTEDGMPRMVRTPWFDHEISMADAAEIGTRKVISEHSTIGLVVTTDGTITDIPREDYLEAEERVITELRAAGKPFVVLVNSAYPESPLAQTVADEIGAKHNITCLVANCQQLSEQDIVEILRGVLFEFPVTELGLYLPAWVETLPAEHPIQNELYAAMRTAGADMRRLRDVAGVIEALRGCPTITSARIDHIAMGTGVASAVIELPRQLFYQTLSQQSGFEIVDDGDLMALLCRLSKVTGEYEKVEAALEDVRRCGYGIVMPGTDELSLEEPEIVKQGGRYGVRLRASAPSIHIGCNKQKCRALKNA